MVKPLTFGKILAIESVHQFTSGNLVKEVTELCYMDFKKACVILSLILLKEKRDILNPSIYKPFAEKLETLGTPKDVATVILFFLVDDTLSVMKEYGLDKEAEERNKIAKIRKDKNLRSFGSKTSYGAIFDAICSRYGWKLEYVLWQDSAFHLKMLLLDSPLVVNLTAEETKKLSLMTELRADDPTNADDILKTMNNLR